MPWISLCNLEDLREGAGHYVEIDGYRLAVFLEGGQVFVMDDACPHAGGSMSGGRLDAGCAVCPWHGWAFGLRDGALRGYDGVTIGTYPSRIYKRADMSDLVQADLPMP